MTNDSNQNISGLQPSVVAAAAAAANSFVIIIVVFVCIAFCNSIIPYYNLNKHRNIISGDA
jgi:hypothetical protein